jgi:hypothetical protein
MAAPSGAVQRALPLGYIRCSDQTAGAGIVYDNILTYERESPMAYAKLNVNDLNKAIAQTKEAIQRSRDLLEAIGENPPIKVLQELADSTPELIKKLEKELKSLEKALEKKTSGK